MANSGIVTVDVHGKTRAQARAALLAALRKCDGAVYRIRVVHGYNMGTELRDMIRAEFARAPRVLRIETGLNPGVTELVLREY
ncbi:MAG TPA: Smr/MutS family protein [Clostridia bacterium]|nr:Smr/MutS family protein [Clostridia bacterium]